MNEIGGGGSCNADKNPNVIRKANTYIFLFDFYEMKRGGEIKLICSVMFVCLGYFTEHINFIYPPLFIS